jgi:hypothetical protein
VKDGKFGARFDHLLKEVDAIDSQKRQPRGEYEFGPQIDANEFLAWRVKARNLISKACGENSPHYTQFVEVEQRKGMFSIYSMLQATRAVLKATKR